MSANLIKYLFSFFLVFLFITSLGQTKKRLIKKFNIGKFHYNLYDGTKSDQKNTKTSYYLITKAGSKHVLVEELKFIQNEIGEVLISTKYNITKSSITFTSTTSFAGMYKSLYLPNKKGILVFKLMPNSFSMGEKTVEENQFARPVEAVRKIDLVADSIPRFPGGMVGLNSYLEQNIKYPIEALEGGVNGKVYAKFIVETDGTITNIEIMRKLGFGCDEEVIRVIKKMPKWIPAKLNNLSIKYQYTLPVAFKMLD